MHQKEIDESVGGVVDGLIVGLIIVFGVLARWPGRTLMVIAAGCVFVGFAAVVATGVDKLDAHAAEVEKKEQAEEQKVWEARLELLNEGDRIASKVMVPVMRNVSGLTDLERLEYLGNGRAQEFRAKYSLSAGDDPQINWSNLSSDIEADIESHDGDFSRTHAQVERVLEQLKPAERYLAVVNANKAYFAGATTDLRLSDAFVGEFERQPDLVLKKPPVPAGARYPR